MPDTAVGSFAGVANPWQLGRLAPGERVLDLGSGAGTDSLVAAQMVGEQGHVTGIDMTPEMLAPARAAAAEIGAGLPLLLGRHFTSGWEEESLGVPPGSTVVEIELEPDGDGTFLRLTHRNLPSDAVEVQREGWEHCTSRLAVIAKGGDPGSDPARVSPPA